MTYKIVEIFTSIEGEGKRAGLPAIFVRLHGCNLNCTYCDTTYAMEGSYTEMTLAQIMDKLSTSHIKRVTLTGGEPLTTPGVELLIEAMLNANLEVNIETNGSVDISNLLKYENLFFTMDYKLPSSGMTEKMHLPNFPLLRPQDVLKFVVGSQEDLDEMLHFIRTQKKVAVPPLLLSEGSENCNCNFLQPKNTAQACVGAVFSTFDKKNIVAFICENPELKDVKLQLQLHKYIWDPSERGV